MNRSLVAATALLLAGGWTAAHAQDDNVRGFYTGAGLGNFNAQIDDVDQTDDAIEKLDDDDAAWKIFAGYRFNPYISAELAYVDFGRQQDRIDASGSSGDFQLEAAGFAPSVLFTAPLGPVELFAKVSYYFYDVDLKVDLDSLDSENFQSSSSDEDWAYGGGIGVTFLEHVNARLEYERISSDVIDDADALWLSASWRF
jgi:OOP family OmpA-OmpF porin